MSHVPGPGQPKKVTNTIFSIPVLTFLSSCDRFYGGFLGGGLLAYTKLIHICVLAPPYCSISIAVPKI